MRKSALLLAFTILLSCARTTGKYCIDGSVYNAANGDVVTIATLNEGDSLLTSLCGIIEDGRFHIEGSVDECRVAYVCCNVSGREIGSILFIEEGKMEVFIDSTHCRITGTPLNELHNAVEDSVRHYVAELEDIEREYYSGARNETELLQLAVNGLMLQEELVNYLRCTIERNINNLLGVYMLVVYNELFSATELYSLMEHHASAFAHCDGPLFYDALMDIVENRTKNKTGLQ